MIYYNINVNYGVCLRTTLRGVGCVRLLFLFNKLYYLFIVFFIGSDYISICHRIIYR